MTDFVNRQKILDLFKKDGDVFSSKDIRHIVNSVKAEIPNKKHWILHDVYCEEQYECPYCSERFTYEGHLTFDTWNFCPKCGNEVRRL